MLDTLLVPAKETGSKWLLIALHGLGDSLSGYRWLPDALGLPWLNHLLVNAPDHYFGGYSWYDFAGDAAPGVARSRAKLFELLEHTEGLGYPAGQTLMFGFSQGCLMTMEVALRYPKVMAGFIGVSGYVHQLDRLLVEQSPVATKQWILATHGTLDPLIPVEPVRQQMALLRATGLNITWREFRKDHTIAGEEELAVIRDFIRAVGPKP